MRPVPPDPELIEWLWSREGVTWALNNFCRVHHSTGVFAVIKDDHECGPNPRNCVIMGASYSDLQILGDIRKYGISGVPREWKREQERLDRLGKTR